MQIDQEVKKLNAWINEFLIACRQFLKVLTKNEVDVSMGINEKILKQQQKLLIQKEPTKELSIDFMYNLAQILVYCQNFISQMSLWMALHHQLIDQYDDQCYKIHVEVGPPNDEVTSTLTTFVKFTQMKEKSKGESVIDDQFL